MPAFPALCPKCQTIFPVTLPFIHPNAKIDTLILNRNVANCPNCGYEEARISDGVFKVAGDTIEIISAPDITVAMLKAFAEIARRTAAGEINPTEAVAEANAISPKLGFLLGTGLANGLSVAALLSSLVTMYLAYSGNKSTDVAAERLLGAVTEQTYVLKDIEKQVAGQNRGAQPADAKAQHHGSSKKAELKSKPKTSRRAQVNHERRKRLRQRRMEFGGARTH
jgi:hypothetical protein